MFPGIQHAISSWRDHRKASRWPTLTRHQSVTQRKSSPFTLWDGSNPSFLGSPFSSAQLPGRLALASIHSFNHRGTRRPLMNSGGAQIPLTMPSTLYAQPCYCHLGEKKPRFRRTELGAQNPTRQAEQILPSLALRPHSLNALWVLGLRAGGTAGQVRGAHPSTSLHAAPQMLECAPELRGNVGQDLE